MMRRWIAGLALVALIGSCAVLQFGRASEPIGTRDAPLRLWLQDSIGGMLTDDSSGTVKLYPSQTADTTGETHWGLMDHADSSWLFAGVDTSDIFAVRYISASHSYMLFDSLPMSAKFVARGSVPLGSLLSASVPESAIVSDAVCPRHMNADSSFTLKIGAASVVNLASLPTSLLNESEFPAWLGAVLQDTLPAWLADSSYDVAFNLLRADSFTATTIVSANTVTATSALNIPNTSIKDHHLDLSDITFDGGDFHLTHGYLIQGNSSDLAQQYENQGDVIIHDGVTTLEAGVVSETHLAVAATSPTYSMWSSCPLLAILADPATGFFWQEDFNWTATAHNGWTSTLTDAGSIIGPLVGYPYIAYGIDATDITVGDNDEGYYAAPGVFALAATKSVWCEANLEIIEGNTDDCNAWFGLTDAALANFLQDNGAGPAASYDGIGFFKVDGGTVWQFETSDGASQTTDTDVGTRVSGTFVRLGFIVTSNTSVTAYVNGVNVASWATNLPDATTLKLVFAVKTGGTIKEYIYFDRARWVQLR
jgi:hypothetical protein